MTSNTRTVTITAATEDDAGDACESLIGYIYGSWAEDVPAGTVAALAVSYPNGATYRDPIVVEPAIAGR